MDAAALGLLFGLVAVALVFDFLNGLHDAANSIATIVSTRVLPPRAAVLWAAFFNFIAFLFFGLHVAQTIGTGIIDPSIVTPRIIFAALMGAISWNLITWWAGIPSSSSHALIGGLLGAGMASAGLASIVWGGVLKTTAAIVISPAVGFLLALALVLAVSWAFVRKTPYAVDRLFRILQFGSASLYSLGHGGNDAQKTMGIIVGLLFAGGHLGPQFYVPLWVVLSCQAAMALGHAVRRVAHRQDHGLQDHASHAHAGLLRGDWRRTHALCSDMARDSGVYYAYDHRRNCWRGRCP
jgi:inorganic phosphate transporter, PiT family